VVPAVGFEVQIGRPDDGRRVRWAIPSRVEFAARFRRGWECLIGVLDGEPVSASWHSTESSHVSHAHAFTLELGHGSAWEHSVYVRPGNRGSGIFDLHWSLVWKRLRETGIRRIYAPIAAYNERSLRAHARVGFEVLCDYHVFRLGGLIRHRVEARPGSGLESSIGWGAWSGTAA
jgi:RimJ/RimL family protein N-acetyltransferase